MAPHPAAYFSTLQSHKSLDKQCFATFLPFRASASSFFWPFLFSDLLSSTLLWSSLFYSSLLSESSHLCFHLSILSEVWLLNFLRLGFVVIIARWGRGQHLIWKNNGIIMANSDGIIVGYLGRWEWRDLSSHPKCGLGYPKFWEINFGQHNKLPTKDGKIQESKLEVPNTSEYMRPIWDIRKKKSPYCPPSYGLKYGPVPGYLRGPLMKGWDPKDLPKMVEAVQNSPNSPHNGHSQSPPWRDVRCFEGFFSSLSASNCKLQIAS